MIAGEALKEDHEEIEEMVEAAAAQEGLAARHPAVDEVATLTTSSETTLNLTQTTQLRTRSKIKTWKMSTRSLSRRSATTGSMTTATMRCPTVDEAVEEIGAAPVADTTTSASRLPRNTKSKIAESN